jgi:hypothetical protein
LIFAEGSLHPLWIFIQVSEARQLRPVAWVALSIWPPCFALFLPLNGKISDASLWHF